MNDIRFNNGNINLDFVESSIHITFKINKFIDNLITFELIHCELMDFYYFTIDIEKNKLILLKGGYFLDDDNQVINNINPNELGLFNYEDLYNNKYINYNDNIAFILKKDEITIELYCKELDHSALLENYKKNIYIFKKSGTLKLIDSYIELGGIYSPQDLLFSCKEN